MPTVAQLKAQLAAKGLPTDGVKAVLEARLGTHHLPSAWVRQGCRSLSLSSAGSSLYSREKVPSLLLYSPRWYG